MSEEHAIEVWNRACSLMPGDDTLAGEGDWALASVILLDGVVQNGGLGSAIEQELIVAGVAGLRWFGLDDVVQVVETAALRVADAAAEDEFAAYGQIESEDDPAYYAIDIEQRLTSALETRLQDSPEAFAPVTPT